MNPYWIINENVRARLLNYKQISYDPKPRPPSIPEKPQQNSIPDVRKTLPYRKRTLPMSDPEIQIILPSPNEHFQ